MPRGVLSTRAVEARGPIAPFGGMTAHPMTLMTSPTPHTTTTPSALPSMPRVAPTTPVLTSAPRAALMTHPVTSSVAPVSPPAT
jgi:hypothetical protein